jgi:hypothetical protein
MWCIRIVKSFMQGKWFNNMDHICIHKMVLIMIFLRLLNTFNGLLKSLVIYMDFGDVASSMN